jgi:hypothetical protein
MPDVSISVPRDRFLPLPLPADRAAAEARRTGVEIEFGGLREAEAAELARVLLGGRVERPGANEARLLGSRIGTLEVVLDTAYRDPGESALKSAVLEQARAVVPVEIVTEPLDRSALGLLERLLSMLAEAGATGTGDGALLGFGVHLNTEVPGEAREDIEPVLLAYALMEDWLREADPIDASRRLLPFVEPYPRPFVDALVEGLGGEGLAGLIDGYLAHNATRNRGLDLLPLFRHLDEARIVAALGDAGAVKPRPTWHYRLPDCRLGDPAWSLAYEWNRWVLVERLAANVELLDRLRALWREHRGALTTVRRDWREVVAEAIAASLLPEAGLER